MMSNKKGQESGTLQSLLVALLVMSAVATLGVAYINGIGVNYGVAVNESQYALFERFNNVNTTLGGLTEQFVTDDPSQNEDTDVISTMITGAYGVIKLVFDVPPLFTDIVAAGIIAVGIPPGAANTIGALIVGIILIMVVFAVLALIMKVRA